MCAYQGLYPAPGITQRTGADPSIENIHSLGLGSFRKWRRCPWTKSPQAQMAEEPGARDRWELGLCEELTAEGVQTGVCVQRRQEAKGSENPPQLSILTYEELWRATRK